MPYVRICHMHVCIYVCHMHVCIWQDYVYEHARMVQPCMYGMNYLYRMHMNTKYTCKYMALQFLVFRELFTIFQNRMDQMEVFIATYIAM